MPTDKLESIINNRSEWYTHFSNLLHADYSHIDEQRKEQVIWELNNYEHTYLAASLQNLFMPYANNKSADQPAHPRSLISTFVVRCLDSIIPLFSISEISSLYIASVAAQAGLGITWSETPKTGFLVSRLNSNNANLNYEIAEKETTEASRKLKNNKAGAQNLIKTK